jgi:hypothetical protein
MSPDEKLDIINTFLSPVIRGKFSKKEIENICRELYLCETEEELSIKIDAYIIEFAYRGQK